VVLTDKIKGIYTIPPQDAKTQIITYANELCVLEVLYREQRTAILIHYILFIYFPDILKVRPVIHWFLPSDKTCDFICDTGQTGSNFLHVT
jgi:hypothetical protein